MKRFVSLLIVLSLLVCQTTMAWESAVHAKGVQDICKAFGFSEEQAIRVGDGAWFDGSDIRIERKEGQKDVDFYMNLDRVFNTGVWAEGTPVKTYGKFAVSPNDTRYLYSKKYLNRAIRLMKDGNKDEAFYALGVGVRSLQNIFANREVANDASWTVKAQMANGASSWIPGMPFSAAWHNVNPEDDVFSNAHADALKAALQATEDYVGDFLAACPQAVDNVRKPRANAVDGIVAETLSLLPLKEGLVKQVEQTGHEIIARLGKMVELFPEPQTSADLEKLAPYALTTFPADDLVTIANRVFRKRVEDIRSDVEDFSGSADADWKTLVKTTDESLKDLRQLADGISKALTEASDALKSASPEEGYAVARKQLDVLPKTVFTLLKPYWKLEQLFKEQVLFWTDVLLEQIDEYAMRYDVALLKNYSALKKQLPKTETAFADFVSASNAAVKAYTSRCDNALADFEQEMAAIAEAFGKDADELKKSAAEQASAIRTAFEEKARQAEESLKGIAPLKQGDEIPKTVEDVIRNLIKDATEQRNNVQKNIVPSFSDNRRENVDPQKIRLLLAARVSRMDYLRPIDIGSTRPDSWTPAVWNSDDELDITFVRSPRFPEDADGVIKLWDKGKKVYDTGKDIKTAHDYYERISNEGATNKLGHDIMGEVGGKLGGKATGVILIKGGELAGKAIGGRFGPLGSKIGKTIGHFVGDVTNDLVGDWIGAHTSEALDWAFGEGTSDYLADKVVYGIEKGTEYVDLFDGYVQKTAGDVWDFTKDGTKKIYDKIVQFFGDDGDSPVEVISDTPPKVPDITEITDTLTHDINKVLDDYDMDNLIERYWAKKKLKKITKKFENMFSGLRDFLSSLAVQIRGLLMGVMNMAVDFQHIDISAEMNKSLKVLTDDLNTMKGKDHEQDKSVKRKATIENKGRDLKRTSNSGNDLKGAPGVKQIEMKSN